LSRDPARSATDAIAELSRILHGIDLPKDRAAAIAEELAALNAAPWAGVQGMAWDTEPFPFDAVLRCLKRPAGGR